MIIKNKKVAPRELNKKELSKICIIHINATQNNTIITGTNIDNVVLTTVSQGFFQTKRGKRSVPQGSLMTGNHIGSVLLKKGFKIAQILIKGFGSGRESAVQGILQSNLKIGEIIDVTPTPHNGCRPRKSRRI